MKAIFPYIEQLEVADEFDWMKKNIFFYEATEKSLIKGIKRFPAGYSGCLLYTSPSPRDRQKSRMPSSA